jgi:murein L,D-transpeptidase YcbB/YkuD
MIKRKGMGLSLAVVLAVAGLSVLPAKAQVTAFSQSVAEAAFGDDSIAAFYRSVKYAPLWTGQSDIHKARRAALMDAFDQVELHGIPRSRYDVDGLMRQMRDARTVRDLGEVEVELSRVFVKLARDMQHGILTPRRVDSGIVRTVNYAEPAELLAKLARVEPVQLMANLAPDTREYRALLKEKLRLQRVVDAGGWGAKIQAKSLKPGAEGASVVALRNRLNRMGLLPRSATVTYDATLQGAVQRFQTMHGLEPDGVAGAATMTQINVTARSRLQSVMVAMERERWLGQERGERHVLVNLTDFHAQIIDNDKVTFRTRSVIGKDQSDRRTPEFSDVMDHMVINPSWYVPRSIITKEYLPRLKRNPGAVGHIKIVDRRGRVVNRSAANFARYTARNFPYSMVQPPSRRNALGLVKFMFPNKYNIYLHDTPEKHLFKREARAYSHGCIRLADPFDFAYALLALQQDDPKGYFQSILRTGSETRVELEKQVPVHLIYRTAFTSPRGDVHFRRDVYGRDAKIWRALNAAGVVIEDVRS